VWDDLDLKPLGGGVSQLTVAVRNTRLIPTVSRQASQHRIGLPDTLSLEGKGVTVLAGGLLTNRDTGQMDLAEHNPERLRLDRGVGSEGVVRVRWFLRGQGQASVRFESQKAVGLTRTLELP
jgi:hypothetical protein